MQESINEAAQAKRRKDAWRSALSATLVQLVSCFLLLVLRRYCTGFWAAALLVLSVLDLGMIVPIWILLKTRLKEIEGGEEDAAAQY